MIGRVLQLKMLCIIELVIIIICTYIHLSDGSVNIGRYYNILGVPKDANESTIKKAYRKLAMKYHPVIDYS